MEKKTSKDTILAPHIAIEVVVIDVSNCGSLSFLGISPLSFQNVLQRSMNIARKM